jgi:hypothetical protein
VEIQYSQLKINHLNNMSSTKAAGGGIFNGVFQQGRQGTSQGQQHFELSWFLFSQQPWAARLSSAEQEPLLPLVRQRSRCCHLWLFTS